MASTYKQIKQNDVASTRTRLHEAIPITGSIVSGTYADNNIKTYAHGMFQSVYDYPYLSSSANHLFDLSLGYGRNGAFYSSITQQQSKKANIYDQFSQVLVGYDATGSIRQFDQDGVFGTGSTFADAIVMPISRLLVKDEIKKESFSLTLGVSSSYTDAFNQRIVITDSGALSNYRINSPAGEYGLLYASNTVGTPISGTAVQAGTSSATPIGLIYYQAGVVVLAPLTLFTANGGGFTGILSGTIASWSSGGDNIGTQLAGATIDTIMTNFRHRIYDMSFSNTTELNSTIYFCRADHNEFNYSANPTYLSSSKMVVKNNSSDTPTAYFTTVGLYSADNELLAVAKLSEPLKKDPTQNYTIRVRLDY